MKKHVKVIALVSAVAMLAALNPVFAKSQSDNAPPERDGVYNVPGHPELKVRVFVHRAKPGKPVPSPSLVCGLADNDSAAEVGAAGWRLPQDFGYYLNLSSVPSSVGSPNWPAIAENSFAAWLAPLQWGSGHYLGTTSINKAARDNRNVISWGRASASALAVTYTWYNSLTGDAIETDTIMNQRYSWSWSNPATWSDGTCAFLNSYDAQDILTHEIGHWFGLADEYADSYADNTMYGYGSKTEVKKDTLAGGDIAGLSGIYGF